MALTIVTGMWGPKRDAYAESFLRAFDRRWPSYVELRIVADPAESEFGARVADTMRSPGRRCRVSWLRDAQGWSDFMERHGADAERCGREPNQPHPWKESARRAGYNFRFDACRFAGQAFAPELVSHQMLDGEVLCWLDADVVAHADVPPGLIEGLLGEADCAYLGRGRKHPEIGFWAVRLNERSRAMLMAFADAYRTDKLFELKEWHSAYVWDDARRWAEDQLGLRSLDLTPGGQGHVFDMQSPLRRFLSHRKGARKGFTVA